MSRPILKPIQTRISHVDTKLTQVFSETRLYFSHSQNQTEDSFARILSDASVDLAAYDVELHRLQRALDSVREKRGGVAKYLDACKSQLAPIRKLPFEVLSTIFLLSTIPELKADGPIVQTLPLDLCCVCVGWRDVVYAIPQFWADIKVGFDRFCVLQTEDIKRSIQRSRNLPLSLHLTGWATFGSGWDDILSNLLLEFSRIRHLHLDVFRRIENWETEPGSTMRRILSSIESFPMLESLELCFYDGYPEETEVFWRAPFLRSLSLDGSFLENWLPRNKFPWPVLETLKFENVELEPSLYDFLCNEGFEQIRTLVLRNIYIEEASIDEECDFPPVFPHLSSLTIDQSPGSGLSDLLQYLSGNVRMPTLESLKLATEYIDEELDEDEAGFEDPLYQLLESSQCAESVTTLHIRGAMEIVTVLSALPNLRTLIVAEVDSRLVVLDDEFPNHLFVLVGSPQTCAKLEHLEIVTAPQTRLNLTLMAQAVASRFAEPFVCIRRFCLWMPDDNNLWCGSNQSAEKGFQKLLALSEQGLEFEYDWYQWEKRKEFMDKLLAS
ncbi:hypothetical protein VKT23_004773 [Stygiomarasmius scandens]|uniref:F-box domain-containing protein n=1 Tax=Marasmiellus scandens TaxID=2682957 RepID=A0ABR1JVW6_9AGAR